MKIYILDQRKDEKKNNATGKALADVFEIMLSNGVKMMPGVPKSSGKILKILDYFILTFYGLFRLGKSDYCIFVYPDNHAKIKLLKLLSRVKRFKIICFIYDVNSIRSGGLDNAARKGEIDNDFALIGSADIIMAPNEGSKRFMESRGMKNRILTVDMWDYLMDEDMGKRCDENARFSHMIEEALIGARQAELVNKPKWKIGFAGNLGKSEFLDNIDEVFDENIEYHLWGDLNGRELKNNNVIYEGSVAPNVLPLEISEKCHFGLVWDGKSSSHIEGGYGEYLRFNNSHKCGCYLASGIPVFVWKESGLSYEVERSGCGFTINGLADIAKILKQLNKDDFDKLIENTEMMGQKVREGYFVKEVLKDATAIEKLFY